MFLLLFFCSTFLMYGQNPLNQGEGIIRITVTPWPYAQEPNAQSGYNKLGDVFYYGVTIYSKDFIKTYVNANKDNKRPLILGATDDIGSISVNEAKQLMSDNLRPQVLKAFNNGGGLRLFINPDPLPPYIDIPVPAGTFYLTYFVNFRNPKFPELKIACPMYDDKASVGHWGQSTVYVPEGQIASMKYTPQPRNWGPLKGEVKQWEHSITFWDFIDYLTWAGKVY